MKIPKNLRHPMLLAAALAATMTTASATDLPGTGKQAAAQAVANVGNVPEHAQTQATERANKALVSELSQKMLSSVELNSLSSYFAPDLIQHDPLIDNGRAAMLGWIAAQRALAPARTLTIKHVLADRDLVFVHAQLSATPDNEKSGRNRYDIYRLDRGQIVEHWAFSAGVARATVSGNSQFSDLYSYETPAPVLSEERENLNRMLVQTLSEEVFGQRNFGLLNRFWAPDYLQHNPYVANGRQALADVLDYIAPEGKHYRVFKAMADGDLTLICAQTHDPGVDPSNEFTGMAVCDIFRVANLELVEHWDVYQAVPASSVNGHSMFSDLYHRR